MQTAFLRCVLPLFFFALLASFSPLANAQNSCADYQSKCDEGLAYAQCKASLDSTKQNLTAQGLTPVVRLACTHPTGSSPQGYFACDVGSTTNTSKYGCFLPSTQVNQQEYYHTTLCEQRPPAGTGQTREWTSRCVGGCLLEIKYGSSVTFSVGAESFTEAYGDLVYTKVCPGDTPNTPDGAGPDKKEECKPIGGYTMCLKGNGDQCLTATSGKKFCWTPGQPSNEVNGNDAVSTDPTAPPPPNLPPADGTGWDPPKSPAPTTNNGTRTVSVGVRQSTGTGSNGGGGTPPGGGGTDPPGNCDPTKGPCPDAGGGQTCGAAPSCSGDPVNCQVLYQAWKTRCAVEGTPLTAGACGSAAPACTGSNVLCAIAERERLHKCDLAKQQTDYSASLATQAAQSDGLDGVQVSDMYSDGTEFDSQLNPGLLGGSGGGMCASTFTLGGQSFSLPSQFWSLAAWVNILLVALAYIWAAQMVIR